MALFFIYEGYMLKKYIIHFEEFVLRRSAISLLISIILLICPIPFVPYLMIDMKNGIFGIPILSIIVATTMTIAFATISIVLSKTQRKNLMIQIGKSSLLIM